MVVVSLQAWAQISSPEVNQAIQDAQRQQQLQTQRLQEQFLKDRASASQPAQLAVPEVAPVRFAQGPCRNIEAIASHGVTLLAPWRLAQVTEAYINRCLNVADIERLLGDVTRLYIEQGWVSARVYLPQQDLSTGQLQLLVVEGKVSALQVEDAGKRSISINNVAPWVEGQPLNLRDIEQALDQINRLASNRATVEMAPGQLPGETVVVLRNEPSFPLHAALSIDNHGAESTGVHQVNATVSMDNPLGLNDFVSITKRQTLPWNDRVRLSTSNSMSYVMPLGYSTLSLSGSHSHYASSFTTVSGNRLQNSGNSQSYGMRLDRVLLRNAQTRWNAYANVSTKKSESYLEGVLLTAASRKLSVFDIGASVNTTVWDGAFSMELGRSRGIKNFGALRDAPDLLRNDAKAQFRKWSISGSYFKPMRVGGQALDYSVQWAGQYAQDVLYGSEQMLVGSMYTVRGFSQNSLSGDHGLNLRNEIGLRRPWSVGTFSASVRSWIGLDYGMVRSRNSGVPEGALTGMALGLQISTPQRLGFDILATKPLSKPAHMQFEPTRLWLRVSAAL